VRWPWRQHPRQSALRAGERGILDRSSSPRGLRVSPSTDERARSLLLRSTASSVRISESPHPAPSSLLLVHPAAGLLPRSRSSEAPVRQVRSAISAAVLHVRSERASLVPVLGETEVLEELLAAIEDAALLPRGARTGEMRPARPPHRGGGRRSHVVAAAQALEEGGFWKGARHAAATRSRWWPVLDRDALEIDRAGGRTEAPVIGVEDGGFPARWARSAAQNPGRKIVVHVDTASALRDHRELLEREEAAPGSRRRLPAQVALGPRDHEHDQEEREG